LNVLHFGWAFLAQYGTGLILEQWSTEDGHRPILAYQVAFGVNVALQIESGLNGDVSKFGAPH
jgi:hypothetical protein